MNISTDTLSVLKNFSDINENLLVKPGNKLQTMSTMKNILAEAEVSEKFESEFGIYKLPEFLRSIELFDKPELKFNGGGYVNLTEEKTKRNLKYFFSDKSVIVSPSKLITMPDKYVTFTLKKKDFTDLMKGAIGLNLTDISAVGDGSTIRIVANEKNNKSSNEYSIEVGETDKKFTANFKTENFKQIIDDYDVAISSKKISHFVNRNKAIQYWIALEPDSEF